MTNVYTLFFAIFSIYALILAVPPLYLERPEKRKKVAIIMLAYSAVASLITIAILDVAI